mmetsp:Transcript_59074/g.156888  ORF Transcript_59074/g.156888 Transcript_59074/m.156888 type:complete len:348 (-) Transcript_59074:45-1088(-)
MCQERPRPVPALSLIPKGKKPQHQSSFPKSRRLSAKDALEIYAINVAQHRANCDPRNRISAVSVARKYGVTEKTVRDIWCGRSWRQETASLSELIPADECVTFLRPRGRPRKADKIFDLDEASSQLDFEDEVSSQVQESASCADVEWDEYTYLASLTADAEFSLIGSEASPSSSSEQEPESSTTTSSSSVEEIITYNDYYQQTLDSPALSQTDPTPTASSCSSSVHAPTDDEEEAPPRATPPPAPLHQHYQAPLPAPCADGGSAFNAGDCVERHLWHLEQDARHDTWNLHHLEVAAPASPSSELPVYSCCGASSDPMDPFGADWNPQATAPPPPTPTPLFAAEAWPI